MGDNLVKKQEDSSLAIRRQPWAKTINKKQPGQKTRRFINSNKETTLGKNN